MAAGVAHEIRNPLAAMRFNLDFLREQGEESPELDVIVASVESSRAVVERDEGTVPASNETEVETERHG